MDRGSTDRVGHGRDDNIEYRRRPIADIGTRYRTVKKNTNVASSGTVHSISTKAHSKIKTSKYVEDVKVSSPPGSQHFDTISIVPSRKMLNGPKLNSTPTNSQKVSDISVRIHNNSQKTLEPINNSKTLSTHTDIHNRRNVDFIQQSKARYVSQEQTRSVIPRVPELPLPKTRRIKRGINIIKRASPRQKSGYTLSAMAVALLIFGVGINIHGLMVTKKIEAHAESSSSANEASDPDGNPTVNMGYSENQPSSGVVSKYTVSPDMPKFLKINQLGIFSRILRVGTDSATGEIGTPKNVFDTAWYDGSAKPGEKGAAFIDGHVSGPTKGGVFVNLKNIKIGSQITIVKGDDSEINYRVAAIEKFDADKVDMAKVLRPYDATKQGLNIMTCNGKFLKDSQTFDKRLVVYTVREN